MFGGGLWLRTVYNFSWKTSRTICSLHVYMHSTCTGLQIRRSNKDNLGIIGHISSEKHIL